VSSQQSAVSSQQTGGIEVKESLYLETTVVSYYTSRLSRNTRVRAHQQITREWWRGLSRFQVFVSQVVVEEARLGDPDAAQRRLEAIGDFRRLEMNEVVENLAALYLKSLDIPQKAFRDAAHLAVVAAHEIDYLVTWNCEHLANARVVKRLQALNALHGIRTPVICTPEELLEV
jgi:predicted nucleic acid-binding protein